jgi:hypothetical protein
VLAHVGTVSSSDACWVSMLLSDNGLAYFVTGFLVVGSVGFLLSLLGLPVLALLRHRDSASPPSRGFMLVDVLCLVSLVGPLTLFVWNLFPEGDKLDGTLYVTVLLLLSLFWWCVIVRALSRRGISHWLTRVVYEVTVLPLAFLLPPVATVVALPILNWWRSALVLLVCLVGYALCIVVGLWVRRRSARHQQAIRPPN